MRKGFTLVEILVTVAIFALGFTAVVAIYIGISAAQNRAKNSVAYLNEAQLVFEQITRQVRDLTLDQNAGTCPTVCSTTVGTVTYTATSFICLKDLANGKTYIKYYAPSGSAPGYVTISRAASCDAEVGVKLNDPNIDILDLQFNTKYPSATVLDEQVLTRIMMKVRRANAKVNEVPLILQTVASSRMYVGRDFQCFESIDQQNCRSGSAGAPAEIDL